MTKKRILSIVLCLCMLCSLLPVTAGAAGVATSHDIGNSCLTISDDGEYTITGTTDSNYIKVEADASPTITLQNATIDLSGTLGTEPAIYLDSGANVTLILIGSSTLKSMTRGTNNTNSIAPAGIRVPADASLTIKDGGSGSLYVASSNWGAGIGGNGGWDWGTSEGSGAITIESGMVEAQGGYKANAIGHGGLPGSNGSLGTAGPFSTGTNGTALIICYYGQYSGGPIGDTTDQENWSGIISDKTNYTVYGDQTLPETFAFRSNSGSLTVREGETLTIPSGMTLNLPGNVKVKNAGTIINEGTISNKGTFEGGGALENSGTIYSSSELAGVEDVIKLYGDFLVTGGTEGTDFTYENGVLTIQKNTPMTLSTPGCTAAVPGATRIVVNGSISGGANITLSGVYVEISTPNVRAFMANSGLNLTLEGENTLKVTNGSDVIFSSGKVTIDGDDDGKLNAIATGGTNALPFFVKGGVSISGGTVTATGDSYGIYGGSGDVSISGGTVIATGGNNRSISGGTVTISGGTVTAQGFYGIGGSTVTISGGTVTTQGANGAGIDGAFSTTDGTGNPGNAFIVTNSFSDPNYADGASGVIIVENAGAVYGSPTITGTATIPADATLDLNGNTLAIGEGGVLVNEGTISGAGMIDLSGGGTIEGQVPSVKLQYGVTTTLTGLESNGAATANNQEAYAATLTAETGYALPESVEVTIAGTEFEGHGYTENAPTIQIPAASITGNIEITAVGVLKNPTINASNGYTGTYDGKDHEVGITAAHELAGAQLSYTVYKLNGENFEETFISTDTGKFNVKDVADSGTYKIVATAQDSNGLTSTAEREIEVSITKATASNPTMPAPDAVIYDPDQTLADIALTGGWVWANEDTVPTVTNGGYIAYYAIADEDNYDWTGVQGYDPANHRLVGTVSVTVNPQQVTAPAADNRIFTYTGSEQTYNLATSDLYTISNNTGTDAGSQTVKVSLNDTDNYVWAGGGTEDKEYTFTINPQQVTAPAADDRIFTYNGNIQTYNLATNDLYTISNNTGRDAGTQTVTVSLNDPANYAWSDGTKEAKTYQFTIERKDITGATITLGDELTYSGSEQEQEVASVTTTDQMAVTTYTVSGNTATDAGGYQLTVEGTGNFKGTATKDWTLSKAQHSDINKSVQIHNGEVRTGTVTLADIYGGEENIPAGAKITEVTAPSTLNIMYSVGHTESAISYVSKDNDQNTTTADVYTVRMETKNYLAYDLYLTFQATDKTPAEIIVTQVNENIYNGKPHKGYTGEPTSDFTGEYAYRYVGTTIKGDPYDSPTPPTEVGSYTVTIKVDVDDPTYIGEISFPMTIGKATVEVTATDRRIYVGETAPTSGLVEGKHYTVTGIAEGQSLEGSLEAKYLDENDEEVETPTDVGEYTIVLSGLTVPSTTADNYNPITFTNGTLTVSRRPPAPKPQPETGSSGGWDEIKDELKDTAEQVASGEVQPGETVTVQMNGATEAPKEVLGEIAGKDVNVEFNMGDGVAWEINGTDIPEGIENLNLGVKTGGSSIPVNVINSVADEANAVQLDLSHDGSFGAVLHLSVNLGDENKGHWANLYYYDEALKELVFKHACRIDAEGGASWPFDHASSYAIVIDDKNHDPNWVNPFTDVSENDWFYSAVEYVNKRGLMNGTSDTLFSPNLTTSRGMIVTILWRLEGEPNVAISETLLDVPESQYYYQAVKWAISKGVLEGYGGGVFRPDDSITREQLATILWRYARYKGIDVSVGEDTNILSYNDAFEISEYAIPAMQWACGEGIVGGYNGNLIPQGNAKRGEAAAMLMRFLSDGE